MAPRTRKPEQPDDPNVPDPDFETKVNLPGSSGTDTEREKLLKLPYEQFYQAKYEEAWVDLRLMPRVKRRQLLETLYRKGFGSEAEVTPDGTEATDVDKLASAYVAAFINARPVKDFLSNDINKLFPDVKVGTGKQRTPAADVDRVFDEVVRVQLGRGPKPEEREKFRNAYASLEAGGNAPSVGSAAEQQIAQQNAPEQQATRFAGFMSQFEQMLRGA